MNNISVLKEIFTLEAKRKSTDSKVEEKEICDKFKELKPKQFDGTLVELADGKIGRMYHSYYGTYKWLGQKYSSYSWSSNTVSITSLKNIKILKSDKLDYEALESIEKKICEAENKLCQLEEERFEIRKKCIHLVHPDSLEETEEENRHAFSLGGGKIYYSSGCCELCGAEVKS